MIKWHLYTINFYLFFKCRFFRKNTDLTKLSRIQPKNRTFNQLIDIEGNAYIPRGVRKTPGGLHNSPGVFGIPPVVIRTPPMVCELLNTGCELP